MSVDMGFICNKCDAFVSAGKDGMGPIDVAEHERENEGHRMYFLSEYDYGWPE